MLKFHNFYNYKISSFLATKKPKIRIQKILFCILIKHFDKIEFWGIILIGKNNRNAHESTKKPRGYDSWLFLF